MGLVYFSLILYKYEDAVQFSTHFPLLALRLLVVTSSAWHVWQGMGTRLPVS